jgi:hypothetical protein
MGSRVWIIAQLVLIVFLIDGMMDRAMAPIAPGPSTPTELTIDLNEVSLKTGLLPDTPWLKYITTTTPVDVIASSTGTSASSIGNAPVPGAEYKQVKLVLEGMGDNTTYTGIDPCTGEMVQKAPIELPYMVADSEEGHNKVTLKYQSPHPVTGVPAGSFRIEPFTVAGPVEFRLIFPASNSVICAADVPSLRTISGTLDNPNGVALDPIKERMLVTNGGLNESVQAYDRAGPENIIRASISGANTGLNNPAGIYVDTPHNEIGVANTGFNSVTIYTNNQGAWGNISPLHIINTGLSSPGGIAIYADSLDSIIVAANGGNHSVTFYSRNNVISGTGNELLHTIKGSNTGLRFPCGLYVDTTHQEIGVANSGNNSVTIYDLTSSLDGNVSPVYTLSGSNTGVTIPCGLYVDPLHDEIGVANDGNNTITFYNRQTIIDNTDPLTKIANVPPLRTLRGNATGLNGPVGIYLDTDQIVVANKHNDRTDDSITTYYREEPSPARSIPGVPDVPGVQLQGPPTLHISAEQQALLVQYFYTGQLDKGAGTPKKAPSGGFDCDGDGTPDILEGDTIICFDGYRFDWKITDNRIRQLGDATSLGILPPNNTAFTFTDGSVRSVLTPGCPVLTPFIILELFSNCPPDPLISSPLPPPSGEYAIPAVILMETKLDNKIPLTTTALTPSQFPQPILTLSLGTSNTDTDLINSIAWIYASEQADPTALPLIASQQVQINLTKNIADVSSCYQQVSGNAQTLVYNSGSLTPDIRDSSDIDHANSQPMINNNGCGIKLSDVDTITFTATDALGNNYIFTWKPT